jgi:hypothetical protein
MTDPHSGEISLVIRFARAAPEGAIEQIRLGSEVKARKNNSTSGNTLSLIRAEDGEPRSPPDSQTGTSAAESTKKPQCRNNQQHRAKNATESSAAVQAIAIIATAAAKQKN